MRSSYRLDFADEGLLIATWGTMVLGEFTQPLTLARVAALRRVLEREAKVRRSFVACAVFELSRFNAREMGAPGVRDAVGDMFKTFAPHVAAFAMVFEGGGLVASTIRSSLTVLSLLVPTERRPRFFATTEEGFEWTQSRAGHLVPGTFAEFTERLTQMRGSRMAAK